LTEAVREVWKKYGESPALVTIDGWKLPPVDLLDTTPEAEYSHADNMERAKKIEEALGSYAAAK
jgi:S-DNA-T family DNA segregation ATPase FtsK/SpoIIIE